MELGKLKSIPPRNKWNNEALDFTPWLASHIVELSNAIGMELEVENTEVSAGPYSADILARDTGTGEYVVIENQLEKTNHDHLGKVITYASVLNASTLIWIASDFTEEHKKSLDWLNDNTNEEISFFGIQIELWQIDESSPALRFNIMSKPNQAVRQAARTKANESLSEKKQFQFEFWSKFRDKLEKTKKMPSLHTPRPQYWFDVSLGKSNIHISNTCNTDENKVGIRIYIRNQIVDTMLPFLESKKEEIERSLGYSLIWNPNPTNRDKTIMIQHATDFSNKQKVEESIDWLIDKTIQFRQVFSKIILQCPKPLPEI